MSLSTCVSPPGACLAEQLHGSGPSGSVRQGGAQRHGAGLEAPLPDLPRKGGGGGGGGGGSGGRVEGGGVEGCLRGSGIRWVPFQGSCYVSGFHFGGWVGVMLSCPKSGGFIWGKSCQATSFPLLLWAHLGRVSTPSDRALGLALTTIAPPSVPLEAGLALRRSPRENSPCGKVLFVGKQQAGGVKQARVLDHHHCKF